jgi:putative membrane protein
MTQTMIAAALAFTIGAAPALAQTSTTTTTSQSGTTAEAGAVAESDQKFVKKVAQDNIAEIDLGTLAQERAQSDEVKQFADRMIQDHGKANEELEGIAQSKKVVIPTEADEEHSKLRSELAELEGEKFDQRYMQIMAENHEKAVELFQQQIDQSQDKELKAFAENTLPVIKEHFSQAQSMVQQAQAQ